MRKKVQYKKERLKLAQDCRGVMKLSKEYEYWNKKLTGDLVKSKFSRDNIKCKLNKDRKRQISLKLHEEVFNGLEKLSNGSDYRLQILITAALNVILYKYSNNIDIVIGTTIYKQKQEKEYINTLLPLRNTIDGTLTFKEVILKVKDCIVEANRNQNYPVQKLLNEIDLKNDNNISSLLDVMILLEPLQDKKYIDKLKSNVNFIFTKVNNGIILNVEYNSNLYSESTIYRIMKNLNNLLKVALRNLDIRIKDLNILCQEEYDELIEKFNYNKEIKYNNELLHELFERQVEETPDNIRIREYNIQRSKYKSE